MFCHKASFNVLSKFLSIHKDKFMKYTQPTSSSLILRLINKQFTMKIKILITIVHHQVPYVTKIIA